MHKMPSMKLRPVVLFALLLSGCADVEYTAYFGQQQNWPVASGSFVQTKFDLPVYFGSPDKPYRATRRQRPHRFCLQYAGQIA
jgi:hypothetical protein